MNLQPATVTSAKPAEVPIARGKPDIQLDVLAHRLDRYGGVIVDEKLFQMNIQPHLSVETFESLLVKSIDAWVAASRRGLWIKVPKERSELIPICVKHGFEFHHAERAGVMLTRAQKEASKIPDYATHTVGIGGFVLNDKGEVLVVAELYAERPKAWKLPGGYVAAGEQLADAATREVFEETGVKTEFRSLNKVSDMYFVALLRPLTSEIVKEDAEIQEARWLKLEDYMSDPNVYPLNQHIAKMVYDNRNDLDKINIKGEAHQAPFKSSKFYTLYSTK